MSIMLAIVLGISEIVIILLYSTVQLGTSVVSFYAADSGIERTMYQCGNGGGDCSSASSDSANLANGSSYEVFYSGQAINVTSTGFYNGVSRSIYVSRQ